MLWTRKKNIPAAPINRYNQEVPIPYGQSLPYYVTAGPVFTAPVEAAILHSKLTHPWAALFGYAYPVARQFNVLGGAQLMAQKTASLESVGMLAGGFAIPPATGAYGQFIVEEPYNE
jgi:hypothetical protein